MVSPHSNDTFTVLALPMLVRLPFRVAEVVAILVAALVTTVGGVVPVVNVMSSPYAVPLPTALALKWYVVVDDRPLRLALNVPIALLV